MSTDAKPAGVVPMQVQQGAANAVQNVRPNLTELANRANYALAQQATVDESLPEHLRPKAGETTGLEGASNILVPPRLKVIQKQSASELLAQFDPGTVVAMPQKAIIAPMVKDKITNRNTETGARFYFVPLFQFSEFCLWEPNGVKPCIVDRSFDPRSKLAFQARERATMPHPSLKGPDGQPLLRKFVEHLNFIVLLLRNGDFESLPVTISFQRGEYRSGQAFLTLATMRKTFLYGCRFAASVHGPSSGRKNAQGEWYGIDVENPGVEDNLDPLVREVEKFNQYRDMATYLQTKHAEGNIQVDHDDDTEEAGRGESSKDF